MHGQAVDFRLPLDYGEAGAFGGPPESLLPAGQDATASGLPPAGMRQVLQPTHKFNDQAPGSSLLSPPCHRPLQLLLTLLCIGNSAPQRPGQKAIKVQLGKGGLPPHLQTPGSGNATPATSTGGMSVRKHQADVCFGSSAAMCLLS
jgi:hypothetical protein